MSEPIQKTFKHETRVTVLLVAAMAALAYLPMAGRLGFYRDDWHVIWSGVTRGALSIFDLHLVDRPFMGAEYAAMFAVLGSSPLAWYLYAFLLRLSGGLAFLWLARTLWPKRRLETAGMALLLVVYPGFLQLPEASAYQCHLAALLGGILSLGFTLQALEAPNARRRLLFTLLGVFSALFSYLMMEWMIGLEGMRLALIVYWTLRRRPARFPPALRFVLTRWLPSLLAAGAFLFWRVFLFKSARPVTDVAALKQMYLANPLLMLVRLAVETGKDFFETVFLAYAAPLYGLAARSAYGDLLLGLALALVGAALLLLAGRLLRNQQWQQAEERRWQVGAMLLGAVSVIAALLPVTLSNRDVLFQDTFDRYTLAAMPGAVMLLVAGLSALLKRPFRAPALALLLVISILTHSQNTAYFRNFWEHQRQLWWQLSWRAPDLKDGTALVVQLPGSYRLAEGYEAWGPANLIYRPQSGSPRIAAEVLNDETLLKILRQDSYGRTFRRVEYTVDFKNLLALSEPGNGACMHVLNGERMEISAYEDPSTRLLAEYSSEAWIIPDGEARQPPAQIFGREPQRGWCYYYQKAGLARQQQNWDEVARLGDEAAQKGLSPQDISEWMPFYEGYARAGNIDAANRIGALLRASPDFVAGYCRRAGDLPAAQDKAGAFVVANICVEY